MEYKVINDAIIREYLLGRLDSDLELVERIDEQTLTDPELSISFDIIEDEIIEEYLEGSLNSEDTQAVESHYLRPPERQRKLKNARLFSRYVEAESRNVKTEESTPIRRVFDTFRGGRLLLSFRTWAEIAAAAVFMISTLVLLNQRHELDMAFKRVSQQLTQERQRSVASNQELQRVLPSLQSAIAMLNLVRPGLQRGDSELPEVKVTSGTRMLHVEVALLSRVPGKYRVQLRHLDKVVWSGDGVDATAVPGGAILKLDIPAAVLPQGPCELAVTPSDGGAISYWFSVTLVQDTSYADITGPRP
jgi:hypothetical protein